MIEGRVCYLYLRPGVVALTGQKQSIIGLRKAVPNCNKFSTVHLQRSLLEIKSVPDRESVFYYAVRVYTFRVRVRVVAERRRSTEPQSAVDNRGV